MAEAPHIVVIGDVIDDVQAVTAGEIRPDTDTLADIAVRPGGSGANTACWAGNRGLNVTFYGRVGFNDVARHTVEFKRFGVTPILQADEDKPTGTIVVIVQGESRSMLSDRGANVTLDVSNVMHDVSERPHILHLTGYSFFHRTNTDDLIGVMERTREVGGHVMIDCSSVGFLEDHGASWWWEIARHATIIKGNADEAEFLTGHRDEAAAKALADKGFIALVTRGSEGASWCEPGGEPQTLPAHPLGEAGFVDPTGAGDAFSAGFIAEYAVGKPLEECVREGLKTSAAAISQPGARPSSPQTH